MGHEVIEHTADLGLRVWAEDLDVLFGEAARALVEIMGEGRGAPAHREEVHLEAEDVEALLVDWLSEILFLFEARGVVPQRVEAQVTRDPWRLEAVVEGPDAEGFVQHGPQVKAVTFHDIEVSEGPKGAEARVYLDV